MSKQEEKELLSESQVDETVLESEVEVVEDELSLAIKKAEEFEDKFLRLNAELQNIQRRQVEERQSLQKYRSQDLAKNILPALDNLERALGVPELTDDVKKGLEMVQESLKKALEDEGITEIDASGQFDHNLHMAVQTVEASDEHPADHVVSTLQKGYQLHERVLRPAMVVVAQ